MKAGVAFGAGSQAVAGRQTVWVRVRTPIVRILGMSHTQVKAADSTEMLVGAPNAVRPEKTPPHCSVASKCASPKARSQGVHATHPAWVTRDVSKATAASQLPERTWSECSTHHAELGAARAAALEKFSTML
eukprot:1237643-Amphidinium_carterae.1